MLENLERLLLVCLAILLLSQGRAEKLYGVFLNEGEGGHSETIKALLNALREARGEVRTLLGEQLAKAVESLDVARRSDLEHLATRQDIERLEAKLAGQPQAQ